VIPRAEKDRETQDAMCVRKRKKGSTTAAEKTDTLHNRMFTFHLLDINQHGQAISLLCPKMENISMRL